MALYIILIVCLCVLAILIVPEIVAQGTLTGGNIAFLIILFALLCYAVFLISIRKKRKEYRHLSGLPLSIHQSCSIRLADNELVIIAGKQSFQLPYYKMKSIEIEKNPNIGEYYKKEVKDMAIDSLFGWVGSLIFHRDKKQKLDPDPHTLVITYIDGAETKQLRFGMSNILGSPKVLVKECNQILSKY